MAVVILLYWAGLYLHIQNFHAIAVKKIGKYVSVQINNTFQIRIADLYNIFELHRIKI